MPRLVKCPVCSASNEKKNTIPYKQRYYCKTCITEDEIIEKDEQAEQYKNLIDYICKLYDIKAPSILMVSQIKNFKEDYGYSYMGMQTTLHYFYELQDGNNVEDSNGVGIIPFVYDDAYNFYLECKEIKYDMQDMQDTDLEDMQQNIVININQSEIKKETDYRDNVFIAIEDIVEEDDE
jgi:hypothetical protein